MAKLEATVDVTLEVSSALKHYGEFVTSLEPPDEVGRHLATPQTFRLLHAALGLTSETGEFVDALKKLYFAGRALDQVNLIEELGDILWYLQLACNALETDLLEVMRVNILKLQKRHGAKFNKEQAGNYAARDLAGERKLLETSVGPSTIRQEVDLDEYEGKAGDGGE